MHVLFVSGLDGDTRRYRCFHHQEQLAIQGSSSIFRESDDFRLYLDVLDADVVVLHRTAWTSLLADVVEIAHLLGKPVVFETDDLIFDPELFGQIDLLNTLPPDQALKFSNHLEGQIKSFQYADCVLTTTQYLARAAERRQKTAYIQRNAFSAEMIAAAERAYPLYQERIKTVLSHAEHSIVIGYFSGTGSHNRDFAIVAPVLARLMTVYPQLSLHLSGHLDPGPALSKFQDRIRRAPFIGWQELPTLIAQVDVNIAPLELDNPFCQAKSEIKFTEAALIGVPTVASPTDAFQYAIVDGETGLLAADPDEWYKALERLIKEAETRIRLGEAARRFVYARYLPTVRSRELVDTLNMILNNHSRPAADPMTVLHRLANSMLSCLEDLADERNQLQRQAQQLRGLLPHWSRDHAVESAEFWRTNWQKSQARQKLLLREILDRLAGKNA